MAGGQQVSLYYPEAAGGTFVVELHGTSTLATVYSDYDCAVTTAVRSISATGRAVFYVKELVDVEVKDFGGTTVVNLVEGAHRAESVAVQSDSFTGTLDGGGSGVGGTIYLKELLDKVNDSFGALDFEVRETGTSIDVPLKTALANLRSNNTNLFNVKSPPYNAVGDGATLDDTAVQAAITALVANGGGVLYFPAGEYLLSQTISFAGLGGVIVLGEAKDSSRIVSTNGANAISVLGIQSLALRDIDVETTSAVAKVLTVNGVSSMLVENADFFKSGGGTAETIRVIDVTRAIVSGCDFPGVSGASIIASGTTVNLTIEDCAFTAPPFQATGGVALNLAVNGCRMSQNGSGSLILLTSVTAGSRVTATGNTITHSNATAGLIELVASLAATLVESGNIVADNSGFAIDPIRLPAGAATGHVVSLSRRPVVSLANGTSGAPRVGVGMTTVTATGNFAVSAPDNINAATLAPEFNGAECAIQIYNSTGGNITVTLNVAYHGTTANLATLATRTYRFKFNGTGATVGWMQQGPFVDVT